MQRADVLTLPRGANKLGYELADSRAGWGGSRVE